MVSCIVGVIFIAFLSRSNAYKTVDPARDEFIYGQFSDDFMFGATTAAYQIEGGWNADGKGPSIWDTIAHSGGIHNKDTGDITCDSYHKYKEDVQMLKKLGVQAYRFSIAWTRIMPNGTKDHINQAGIDYYNNLINELKSNGIEPMVTLLHFDTPNSFYENGTWLDETIIEHFVDYANVCFQKYGDRVKLWITMNEPMVAIGQVSLLETFRRYGKIKEFYVSSKYKYQAAHNMIKAHARVYRLYEKDFKPTQKGKVSIVLNGGYCETEIASKENQDACERNMQFDFGLYAHPIFLTGDYPDVVKDLVANKSLAIGKPSRLSNFTENEKKMIKGSYDFFALNHYSSHLGINENNDNGTNTPQDDSTDRDCKTYHDSAWPKSDIDWLVKVPWGLRKTLKWIKYNYNDPEIYITENGCHCPGEDSWQGERKLQDDWRIDWYNKYINEALKAYKLDGVKLKGFYAWSLMDNLEWTDGFSRHYGLHTVNMSDPERPRTQKNSAAKFRKIVKDNGFVASMATKDVVLQTSVVICITIVTVLKNL